MGKQKHVNQARRSVMRQYAGEDCKEISKHCTTIVIAHRLSTIKNSNKIIVLGKTNIAEQGTHDELIENNNFYKQLWDIQTGNN